MQVFREARMVVAVPLIVHAMGSLKDSVQTVMGKVALSAAAFPANQAHRLELGQQILGVTVDM